MKMSTGSPNLPRPVIGGKGGFKVSTAFLVAAVAISAGVPGLLPFDPTSQTNTFGLFNVSSLWRLAVFGATALFILSAGLLWNRIVVGSQRQNMEFTGLAPLLLFFGWILATSTFTLKTSTDFALAYYRLLEWGLTILVVWQLISFGSESVAKFEQLVRAVSATALVLVLAIWAIAPSVATVASAGPLGMQLGHAAYHSNYLAVILGIGAMYWWTTVRTPIRYLVAPVMLFCCLLTGSRSGIVGTAAAMLALALLSVRGNDWTQRLVVRAGLITVIALLSAALFPEIVYLLSREQGQVDIATFNSRTMIWEAAVKLIDSSPWIGNGFIAGPRLIASGFHYEWLAPRHAHNDFLNAAVAGGIPAALMLGAIYFLTLARSFRLSREHPLLSVTCIPILLSSLFEPNISGQATVIAVVSVALLRTLAIVYAGKSYAAKRPAPSRQPWPGSSPVPQNGEIPSKGA